MANVIIEELVIQADKAGSLNEVKKALRDIKGAMLNAGDEGSADFQRLSRAAAELKDKVEDANAAIDRANPDKFNGLASAAKIAATGIQLTTGAMALFGDESEDVQKALMKVQAAMMFAEGLQNVKELEKDFIKLGNTIKANPIFAIAAVLIAIGAAAYTMYQNYKDANSEATKLAAIAEQTKKTGEQQIATMDNQLKVMVAQGANAFDIHKKEQEILDVKIRIAEASLAHKRALVQEQKETETLWEQTQSLLALTQPDYVTEAINKKIAADKLARIQAAKDEEIKAQQELDALKTDVLVSDAKYQSVLVEQSKKASDDKIKIAEDEAKKLEELRKKDLEHKQSIAEFDDFLNADKTAKADQAMNDQLKRIEIEHDAMVAADNARIKREKDAAALRKQLNSQALTSTADLFGSLGELSKKNAKTQKAFAVGQATINTYQGVTKALASFPPPVSFIAAAAALAAGLVQIRNIMSTKEDGGSGGGGGGVGSSPNLEAINTAPTGVQPSTLLDENGNVLPQQNQQPQVIQAFMVESQATGVHNQVHMIENQMRFQ